MPNMLLKRVGEDVPSGVCWLSPHPTPTAPAVLSSVEVFPQLSSGPALVRKRVDATRASLSRPSGSPFCHS